MLPSEFIKRFTNVEKKEEKRKKHLQKRNRVNTKTSPSIEFLLLYFYYEEFSVFVPHFIDEIFVRLLPPLRLCVCDFIISFG